ncbi:hypothetical protein [Clostridium felsineum]|uniref:hypothetical protein n=1 Tax=Clostridium felsineum TaxID=36839 RepID=UPI0009C87F00|nr:hypothetical protein CLFE_027140 [Clostridium felsineum DSM 794]
MVAVGHYFPKIYISWAGYLIIKIKEKRRIKTRRKDFEAKPYLYPQPVLIIGTYSEDGTTNAMNAAYLKIGEKVGNAFSDGKKLN